MQVRAPKLASRRASKSTSCRQWSCRKVSANNTSAPMTTNRKQVPKMSLKKKLSRSKSQQVSPGQKLNGKAIVYKRLRDNQWKALNRSSSSTKCAPLSDQTLPLVSNSAPQKPTIGLLRLARIATLSLLCQLVLYGDVESQIMNVRVGKLHSRLSMSV